jgi:hypothetical protein
MTLTPQPRKPASQHASKLAVLLGAILTAGVLAACGGEPGETMLREYLEAHADCGDEAAQAIVEGAGATAETVGEVRQEMDDNVCTPRDLPSYELTLVEEEGSTARYDVRFDAAVDDVYDGFEQEDSLQGQRLPDELVNVVLDLSRNNLDDCFEGLYEADNQDGITRLQVALIQRDQGWVVDLASSCPSQGTA